MSINLQFSFLYVQVKVSSFFICTFSQFTLYVLFIKLSLDYKDVYTLNAWHMSNYYTWHTSNSYAPPQATLMLVTWAAIALETWATLMLDSRCLWQRQPLVLPAVAYDKYKGNVWDQIVFHTASTEELPPANVWTRFFKNAHGW